MNRLRRLARRGSLAWIVALIAVGGTALSPFAAPRRTSAARPPAGAPPVETARSGSGDALAALRGIPQSGATLGDPRAPATLIEFADLQCPYCAATNTRLLLPIIERYVRTGRVKLVFRPIAFLGPDSERLASVATAAGQQDHLWDFVELAFEDQGAENSGYATDAYLRSLVAEIPGVDASKAMADRDSAAALAQLREASEEADRLGVRGTPSFFLARAGQPPRPIDVRSLTSSAFDGALAGEPRSGPARAS